MPDLPTVAYWIARGDAITVYCGNHKCARNRRTMPGDPRVPHGKDLDLTKLDPSWTADDVRARLKCDVCGERKASLRVFPALAPGAGRVSGW